MWNLERSDGVRPQGNKGDESNGVNTRRWCPDPARSSRTSVLRRRRRIKAAESAWARVRPWAGMFVRVTSPRCGPHRTQEQASQHRKQRSSHSSLSGSWSDSGSYVARLVWTRTLELLPITALPNVQQDHRRHSYHQHRSTTTATITATLTPTQHRDGLWFSSSVLRLTQNLPDPSDFPLTATPPRCWLNI